MAERKLSRARAGDEEAADIEEEASEFAAALLIPAWLMVREHARCRGDLDVLCRRFDSSRAAMERRISGLFGAGATAQRRTS